MAEKCYCCNNQEALEGFNSYGVPICPQCHMGIALCHWGKPSKKAIDDNRDKMFSRAERIKNALAKQGIKWHDPRTPIEDLQDKDETL